MGILIMISICVVGCFVFEKVRKWFVNFVVCLYVIAFSIWGIGFIEMQNIIKSYERLENRVFNAVNGHVSMQGIRAATTMAGNINRRIVNYREFQENGMLMGLLLPINLKEFDMESLYGATPKKSE
jgi:hypothetical protein